MGIAASTGARVAIGPTTPAASEAEYAALTYVPIGEIESIGEFADASTSILFTSLSGARSKKRKGARDAGDLGIVCANSPLDPGQAAAVAAETTSFSYAVRVTLVDAENPGDPDSAFYFHARVTSARLTVGSANEIVKRAIVFAVDTPVFSGGIVPPPPPLALAFLWNSGFGSGQVTDDTLFDGSVQLGLAIPSDPVGAALVLTDPDGMFALVDNGDGSWGLALVADIDSTATTSHPFSISVSGPTGSDTITSHIDVLPANGGGAIDEVPGAGFIIWEPGMLGGEVPEGTAVGTVLAHALAIPGQHLTYVEIYDPDSKIDVAADGTITLAAALNYTADPDHPFTVRASTSAGALLIQGRVTVLDQPPTSVAITWGAGFPGGFIPEGTTADGSVALATVLASPGHSLVLSITDPDNKLALTDNGDGTGTLYLNGALSSDSAASHAFTITATNALGSISRPDLLVVDSAAAITGTIFVPFSLVGATTLAGAPFGKFVPIYGGSSAVPTFVPATFDRTDVAVGTPYGSFV